MTKTQEILLLVPCSHTSFEAKGLFSVDIVQVYNCRTASTWSGDMALSVSFSLRNLTTYAVVYGCDDEAADFLIEQLTGTDHPVFHPMLLPTLLADIERERHVKLLRKNSGKMGQLTLDLTVNKGQEIPKSTESSSQLDDDEEEPIELWQDMSNLQNGFQNWQQQMRRMVIHLERSSNAAAPGSTHYDLEIQKNLEKLKVPSVRIQKRLEELISEYDEHIRDCATVTGGLKLAMSMVSERCSIQ